MRFMKGTCLPSMRRYFLLRRMRSASRSRWDSYIQCYNCTHPTSYETGRLRFFQMGEPILGRHRFVALGEAQTSIHQDTRKRSAFWGTSAPLCSPKLGSTLKGPLTYDIGLHIRCSDVQNFASELQSSCNRSR